MVMLFCLAFLFSFFLPDKGGQIKTKYEAEIVESKFTSFQTYQRTTYFCLTFFKTYSSWEDLINFIHISRPPETENCLQNEDFWRKAKLPGTQFPYVEKFRTCLFSRVGWCLFSRVGLYLFSRVGRHKPCMALKRQLMVVYSLKLNMYNPINSKKSK